MIYLDEPEPSVLFSSEMDAMERLRRRIHELLDVRTHTGKLRHKRLAEHLNKSEAWLSNILEGRRGLRLTDLDNVAEFFRVPPSELVRLHDTELEEVTPTERTLLRRLRRAKQEDRDAIFRFAGLADGHEIGQKHTRFSAVSINKPAGDGKVPEQSDTVRKGTDRAPEDGREQTPKARKPDHPRRPPSKAGDSQSRLRARGRSRSTGGMETSADAPTTAATDGESLVTDERILEPCEE